MPELIEEFVDSRALALRVDPERGIVRGVKLLGLVSANGRRYAESALATAVPLYEGAKVNVNHARPGVAAARDYQDRLGVVRGVAYRAGEGLFGDLHYNPKHALAEQLAWDAQHAAENVGLSHSVLAQTRREGTDVVVEAITKVNSVDLVADPATTRSLFEHDERPALATLTLAQLKHERPDLVSALVREVTSERSPLCREQSLAENLAPRSTALSGAEFAKVLKRSSGTAG